MHRSGFNLRKPGPWGEGARVFRRAVDHQARVLPLLLAVVTAAGCRTVGREDGASDVTLEASYRVMEGALPADAELERLVQPYREVFADAMSEVVANAAFDLVKARPEGVLGNLAADAILAGARELSSGPVDFAVTGHGGLRVPLREGPVTVGDVYELMPFENQLVVLTLSGEQVAEVARSLARRGGEPVSGIALTITGPERNAAAVRVGGQPLDLTRTYRVATDDYRADGGDRIFYNLDPQPEREALPMTVRDAFLRHFRRLGTLAPQLEGRIISKS